MPYEASVAQTARTKEVLSTMTDMQLDQTYTALAEAISRLGKAKAELFLATLALDLLSQQDDPQHCLKLIARAEHLARR